MTPGDPISPGSLAAASREALSAAGALAQADARHVERAVQLRMAEAVQQQTQAPAQRGEDGPVAPGAEGNQHQHGVDGQVDHRVHIPAHPGTGAPASGGLQGRIVADKDSARGQGGSVKV